MKKALSFILLIALIICFSVSCRQPESSKNGNEVLPGYKQIVDF